MAQKQSNLIRQTQDSFILNSSVKFYHKSVMTSGSLWYNILLLFNTETVDKMMLKLIKIVYSTSNL